ncbi:MAG: hypothetical protein DMF26_00175 [Verrucomicrobia bacterium]|nr:MAG: hypothetical protein DMF26_00175 [Verrucomicrobiota bacterium]
MKTRTTSSKLILLLLIGLALSATTAQAIVIEGSRPVGITFGQTARVTAANTGTTAIIIDGSKFFDSDGNVLVEFGRQVIDPGKMMSFDLNADDIIRESNRIEIRSVITAETARGLLISAEVFENDTEKTTVFVTVGK